MLSISAKPLRWLNGLEEKEVVDCDFGARIVPNPWRRHSRCRTELPINESSVIAKDLVMMTKAYCAATFAVDLYRDDFDGVWQQFFSSASSKSQRR